MAIHDEIDTPLALACRKAGGQSALARIVGKDQSTIHERLVKRGPIWPESVLKIEAELDISRSAQRPDLYPEDSSSPGTQPGEASPAGSPSAGDAAVSPRDTDPSVGLLS